MQNKVQNICNFENNRVNTYFDLRVKMEIFLYNGNLAL